MTQLAIVALLCVLCAGCCSGAYEVTRCWTWCHLGQKCCGEQLVPWCSGAQE